MNHKRGKPKSARAGCLWCKPHKRQGVSHRTRYPRETAHARQDMKDVEYDKCATGECLECLEAMDGRDVRV